jgi:Family of unknown function (DUF6184)
MRLTLIHGACALGVACAALTACSKTQDRQTVSAAEQRRIDERRIEERRAEEHRAVDRKADAEDRRADRIAEERRAEERRAEERRADDRRDGKRERLASSVDPAIRATPSSAVTSLATERCDREARCNNIGAKEKYKSRADCVAELERDKRDDINSDVCRGGIRQKELNDCLQAIHDEGCSNPLDAITRLAACRTGNLCAK